MSGTSETPSESGRLAPDDRAEPPDPTDDSVDSREVGAAAPRHPMPGPGAPPATRTVAAWNAFRAWRRRVTLPLLTVAVFLVIAMILWANLAVNHYRFNLAIAVLGSVPLAVLLIRGAQKARHADHGEQQH